MFILFLVFLFALLFCVCRKMCDTTATANVRCEAMDDTTATANVRCQTMKNTNANANVRWEAMNEKTATDNARWKKITKATANAIAAMIILFAANAINIANTQTANAQVSITLRIERISPTESGTDVLTNNSGNGDVLWWFGFDYQTPTTGASGTIAFNRNDSPFTCTFTALAGVTQTTDTCTANGFESSDRSDSAILALYNDRGSAPDPNSNLGLSGSRVIVHATRPPAGHTVRLTVDRTKLGTSSTSSGASSSTTISSDLTTQTPRLVSSIAAANQLANLSFTTAAPPAITAAVTRVDSAGMALAEDNYYPTTGALHFQVDFSVSGTATDATGFEASDLAFYEVDRPTGFFGTDPIHRAITNATITISPTTPASSYMVTVTPTSAAAIAYIESSTNIALAWANDPNITNYNYTAPATNRLAGLDGTTDFGETYSFIRASSLRDVERIQPITATLSTTDSSMNPPFADIVPLTDPAITPTSSSHEVWFFLSFTSSVHDPATSTGSMPAGRNLDPNDFNIVTSSGTVVVSGSDITIYQLRSTASPPRSSIYALRATLPINHACCTTATEVGVALAGTTHGIIDSDAPGTIPTLLPTTAGTGLALDTAAGTFSFDETYMLTTNSPGTPAPMPTAPTVSSVVRASSASADTMGGDVTWTVTFSENVENVGTGDFEAIDTSNNTVIGTTTISGSGLSYTVTTDLPTSGHSSGTTVGLRVVSSHGITAMATGNTPYAPPANNRLLTAAYGSATNQTYTLMTPSAPTFSFVGLETTTTDDDTARFRLVVPSMIDLMTVAIGDFTCNDSTGSTLTPTIATTPARTATSIEILCTHGIAVGMMDTITAGFTPPSALTTAFTTTPLEFPSPAMGTATNTRMYQISPADRTGPYVMTITSGTVDQAARTIEWTITFSEVTENVTSSSFSASGATSFGTFTQDTTNGAVWTVTTTTQAANNMPMVSITERATSPARDAAGNTHSRPSSSPDVIMGTSVTFNDNLAPSISRVTPTSDVSAGMISWTIIFDEAVTGVDMADFAVTYTGTLGMNAMNMGTAVTSIPTHTFNADSATTYTISISGLPTMGQEDPLNFTLSLSSTTTGIMDMATPTANAFAPASTTISGAPVILYTTGLTPTQTVEAIQSIIQTSAVNYISSTPSLVSRISSRLTSRGLGGGRSVDRNDQRFVALVDNNYSSMSYTGSFDLESSLHNFRARSELSTMEIDYSGVYDLGFIPRILDRISDWGENVIPSETRANRDRKARRRAAREANTRAEQSRRRGTYDSDISSRSRTDNLLGLEFWVQLTHSESEDNQERFKTKNTFIHAGLDAPFLLDNTIAGLMVQYDTRDDVLSNMNVTGTSIPDGTITGEGWFFGPYVASNFYGGLVAEARFAYGESKNTINPIGNFSDDFETDRVLASASLSGAGYGGLFGWDLTPRLDYSYYSEDSESYMNSQGTMISDSVYTLNRFSFSPSLSRSIYLSGGSLLVPSFALSGYYDESEMESSGMIMMDEAFIGKFDMGFAFTTVDGFNWNVGGYYDGIGGDITSYGFTTGLRVNF